MCNSLLGRSKARKAAEAQAKAEEKTAERAAQADTEAMRSNQIARETAIGRERAVEDAAQFLNQPVGDVDVDVAVADPAEIDPETGRRRPIRAAFMSRGSGSYNGLAV